MARTRPGAGRPSPARYILASRLLRGAAASLVISGIGMSVTAPQMTLFLVRDLQLSDTLAGLYYLTNLAAPIAGFVVGSLSDRAGSRLLVFRLSALAGFLGWGLMAFATDTWMPFVINIVLLSVAGAGAAQLQAAVRDELDRHPTPVDNQVVAVMRMSMAVGWIVGPVFGALLGATIGLRPLLLATGISILLSLVPLIGVRAGRAGDRVGGGSAVEAGSAAGGDAAGGDAASGAVTAADLVVRADEASVATPTSSAAAPLRTVTPPPPPHTASIPVVDASPAELAPALAHAPEAPAAELPRARGRTRGPSMAPLLLFTAIYVLIMCGETVKLAYLPLYLDGELHVSAAVRGAIIGLQPLIEVALMPLAARLADRFGIAPVLFAGAGMAVAAHLCYASADLFSPAIVPLIVGQLFMAGVIATFGVLGVTVAQRFQPDRVGMASSVFLSAFAINAAVGGFLGSVGTAWLGLPHLFWIPATIAALGTVALVFLNAFVPLGTEGARRRRSLGRMGVVEPLPYGHSGKPPARSRRPLARTETPADPSRVTVE